MISLLNEIKIKILSDFEQLKLHATKTFREIAKDIANARTKLNSEGKLGAQKHTGKYKQATTLRNLHQHCLWRYNVMSAITQKTVTLELRTLEIFVCLRRGGHMDKL